MNAITQSLAKLIVCIFDSSELILKLGDLVPAACQLELHILEFGGKAGQEKNFTGESKYSIHKMMVSWNLLKCGCLRDW